MIGNMAERRMVEEGIILLEPTVEFKTQFEKILKNKWVFFHFWRK
jgi:hypothetical protein